MTLKTRTGAVTKTHCNSCNKLLREDIQLTSIIQKVMLKETVVNLGKGRHKCKSCYKREIKSRWRFNLSPLKKERT